MAYQLTILVPLYNEEENLLRVEQELSGYLQRAPLPACVLFIDDGSTDNSAQLLQTICERNTDFSFVSFQHNKGLSTAIKAGFDLATSPLIGYIDCDLQTHPADFDLLLAHIDSYDLVTGLRVDRQDSWSKRASSALANRIRRTFTHDGMDDTGCPLKVIKTAYAKRIPMFKGLHRFLPAMVLLQGGKVKQVPVRHFPRLAGSSKFNLANRLVGPLMACFAYRWMKKNYIHYCIVHRHE